MRRWSSVAVVDNGAGSVGPLVTTTLAVLATVLATVLTLTLAPTPVGASGRGKRHHASGHHLMVRVSPDRHLVDGQVVTVSGTGLTRADGGDANTWFVLECTSAVHGHVDANRDAAHCDVTHAHAIRVARDGAFSTTYHVVAGIVGDGYCGTAHHLNCVLGVGTAAGRGTVVRISFKHVPSSGTSTR